MDSLNPKIVDSFLGKIVRKDLTAMMRQSRKHQCIVSKKTRVLRTFAPHTRKNACYKDFFDREIKKYGSPLYHGLPQAWCERGDLNSHVG